MLQGMVKLHAMHGLTKPEVTTEAVQQLLDKNVPVTTALAQNSAMSRQTKDYLPSGARVIDIVGNGIKIGHVADEHVALSALVVAIGTGAITQTSKS